MTISIKLHKSYRTVASACDLDLIGKKFEEGKMQLNITENFFKGAEFNENEAILLMQEQNREDATFNIVGKETINAALKAEIITEKDIIYIQEIPFALKLL